MFGGIFDDPIDSSQVHMSKDNLFRHIIQFGALSFNLVYIGVFLVLSRKDCIALNTINSGLFILDVIR